MKIAVITPWDIECGIALYAENLVEQWVDMGHEVVVLAETVPDDWLVRREAPLGLPVIRCWSRDSEWRRLLETVRHLGGIDVVNIQHEMSYCSLPHLWRQLIEGLHSLGLPVTVTYHTYPLNTHPVTEYRGMESAIVLNHHARAAMVRRGWPGEKAVHIPHAAIRPISPAPERKPVGRVVTWGFLTSHKGYSGVMEAMAPLFPKYPRSRLTIYGAWVRHVQGHQEHYLNKELRPEIATRGLADRVGVLTGFPHQRVLQDLIADNDIAVLYYGVNNTGYASSGCLQTAFSAGRPVIASKARHFDLPEEYEDAVLRAETTIELREHIDNLLSDSALFARMAARSREIAEERNQEHAAADYVAAFEDAVRRFTAPPALKIDRPLVSVVIPTQNRREELRRAIESSRHPGVEIVVVDDAGTDETPAMIEKDYPFVKLVALPVQKGQSYARNVGAQEASGVYVKFLDDDDYHVPGWAEKLIEAAEDGYDVITIGCAAPNIQTGVEGLLDVCRYTSQIAVKKEAFFAVGGFDEKIRWQEEHELLKRLDDAAYKAYRVPFLGVIKQRLDQRGFTASSDQAGGKARGGQGRF